VGSKKVVIDITAKDSTKKGVKSAETGIISIGKAAARIAPMLGAAFGASKLADFAGKVVSVTAEFQKLKASLTTVTGSAENANAAFGNLQQFAKDTPFQLQTVVSAFVKMKALGLDPSNAALMSYGNTASAMGKDLNQMIEAVADASTGEFERLKEFGIKAKQQGDSVSLTFQGVTTTIGKDSASIEGYLKGLGDVQFAGAMNLQMSTVGGALSNLEDSFDSLLYTIGDAGVGGTVIWGVGELTTTFTGLGYVVSDVSEFVDGLDGSLTALTGSSAWQAFIKGLPGIGAAMGMVDTLQQYGAYRTAQDSQAKINPSTGRFIIGEGQNAAPTAASRPSPMAPTAAADFSAPDVDLSNQYGPMLPNDVWQERRDERFAAEQEWNARMLALQIEAGNQQALAAEEFAQQEIESDRRAWEMKTSAAANGTSALMNLTNALYVFGGKKSRAMFEVNKIAGIANIGVSTYTAAAGAMKDTPGPYWVRLLAAGAITAAGVAQAANVSGMSFDGGSAPAGGTGGGTSTSPVVTQPGGSSQQSPQEITIKVIGVISDATVENLVDRFNDAGSRGVRIDYSQG
jgi:hypothetical protein